MPDVPDESAMHTEPSADAAEHGRVRLRLDPVSAWLLKVVLALVVVLVALTLAMAVYLTTLHRAPRTTTERDISVAEVATEEHGEIAGNWADLAYAYAAAGRYDDALAAARTGRERTRQDILLLAEADVLRVSDRNAEAIAAYDRALVAISKADTEAAAARQAIGVYVPADETTLARVYVGRAICKREMGDTAGAIADLEKALAITPEQATVLVTLGDYYRDAGEPDKAADRYREALRFVPDYRPALEGLARVEAGE